MSMVSFQPPQLNHARVDAGTLITDDARKANLLNEYFGSVCNKPTDNGLTPDLRRVVADIAHMDLIHFPPCELKLAL